MITLPLGNQRWPKFRLLTRASWGGTTGSGVGWQIRPMQNNTPYSSGFILRSYTRSLLPQIGTCEILYRFGEFSGRVNSLNIATAAAARQGEPWDPATSGLSIPDLTGLEIRVQAAYPDETGDASANEWKTVWWGTCEYQTDEGWGAATIPSGERTYHCLDAFARTRRWFLNRHGFTDGESDLAPAPGHPGYNVSRRGGAQVAGNKGPVGRLWTPSDSGIYARCMTMPGAGETYTDEDVINDALVVARPPGAPLWQVAYPDGAAGAPAQMSGDNPWPVDNGATAFDMVASICKRSRGRGAVFPTWTESSPTGPLTCKLLVTAQIAADINWTDPTTDGAISIDGAIADGTSVNVDVIGDHRFLPDSLMLGDPEQFRVECLISQGEQIEVVGTVEYDTTLTPGWSESEQTAFLDLDPENRLDQRWAPVYQLHRLKRTFAMQLSNGNQGAQESADFRCLADGTLSSEAAAPYSYLSSIEVMDDLPLFEGYTYTSTPVRADGQTAAAFGGTPARRPPMLLLRTDDDRFIRHEEWSFSVQLKFMPDGFLVTCKDDQGTGRRQIGDEEDEDLGSQYDYDKLVMTLGFRLGHRVQITSGNPNSARRTMIIPHPDVHLWVAAPNAIWDLDATTANDDGCQPRRGAAASVNGILRDDRSTLARAHAMERAWYGVAEAGVDDFAIAHRNASWSLRCCGDIPSTEDYDGGGVVYPTCGQVVQYLTANGQRIELNTVVSSVSYDNTAGITTWTTDWQDLDLSNG